MGKYRLPPLAKHGGYQARTYAPRYAPYTAQPDDKVREVLTGAGAYKLRNAYDNLKRKKFAGTIAALAVGAYKHRHNAKRLYDFVKSAQEKRHERIRRIAGWEQAHTPPNRRLNFGQIEPPKIKGKRSGGRRARIYGGAAATAR